jgi:hypothetical protein
MAGSPGSSYALGKVIDAIQENDSAFNTRLADGTQNRIDASGEYNFNTGRHRFLENGTFVNDLADTTKLDDQPAKMQVTASAGDELIFGARELLRYVPNYELLFGVASWSETALQPGQHFAKELMDADGTNGYRYHYAGTADGVTLTLEQFQGNTTPVDTKPVDLDHLRKHGFDHTEPHLGRCKLNWYGAGLGRYELSFPTRDPETGQIDEQKNLSVGRTANDTDVATDRINLRVQTRVWCDAGAPDLTVNVCSLGALIRGSATQRNREKPGIFWDVGGTISQYPTDNVTDAMAARIDPDRREVAAQLQPPLFQPAGSDVTIELGVYAVHKDEPDLTVNFDDPDDDGTDEGPSPAAQAKAQTDVMQYTRDVTAVPTVTDIRADGTEGLVPDMRQLTSTVGQSGGGNSPGSTTGGEGLNIKRNVYPDDVLIFLPRSDPEGNTTAGRLQWLKPLFEQDW